EYEDRPSSQGTVAGRLLLVSNTDDDGPGSLREAISDANATPEIDTIFFHILGQGPHRIAPTSPLPPITAPLIIDGYSHGDSRTNSLPDGLNTVLRVELNGAYAGPDASGIVILSPGCVVRGLAINGFAQDQLLITGPDATGNLVEGNFIGTDLGG